jgi:TP901 family phage tail tape measure protein
MAQLPEIGAYAVLRGTQQFVADAFRVERSIAGLNAATATLGAESVRGFNRAGSAVAAFGTAVQIGIGAATVALGAAATGAKNVASDFEETMTFIGSITQTAGQPLVQLGRDIDTLSLQGTFGLRQLSEAGAELARSGLAFDEISGGALRAAQNFAIAARGELDLAEASQIVATSLQTFNLRADESNRITDAITGVAQRSTASFRDLGVAFNYSAAAAQGLGIPIEDLTAVIGVAADAGIRGSRAGTALRQVFTTLVDPPKRAAEELRKYGLSIFDADGNTRKLRDVLIDFERELGPSAVASGKLTEAQRQNALATIFTQNAYSVMNGILNRGVGEFDAMRQAIEEVSAAEVAADLLTTTNARTKLFQATVESAANAIGQSLLPAFNQLVIGATGVAEAFRVVGFALQALSGQDATPLFQEFEFLGEDVSGKILPILDAMVSIGSAIDTVLKPAIQSVVDAFAQADFTPVLDAMGSSIQFVIQGFLLLVNVAATAASSFAQWISVATQSEEVMTGIGVLANIAGAAIIALGVSSVASFAAFAASIAVPAAAVGTFIVGLAGLAGRIKALETELGPVFANLGENIAAVAETFVTSFSNLEGDIVSIVGQIFDAVGTAAHGALDIIVQLFSDLGADITPIIDTIGATFASIGEAIGTAASSLGTAFSGVLNAIGEFKDSIVDVGTQVISFLAPAFDVLVNAVKPFIIAAALVVAANVAIIKIAIELGQGIARLAEDFERSFSAAKESVANSLGFINELFGTTQGVAEESANGIAEAFETLGSFLDSVFDAIGTTINNFGTMVANVADFFGESFGRSFENAGESITNIWTQLWESVGTIFSNFATGFTELFFNIWNEATRVLGEFIDQSFVNIRFFLTSLGNSFSSAGTAINNIWLAVWNGMIGIVREAINTMAGMINQFFAGLSATPLGQFIGGLEGAFSSATGAITGAFDEAGNRINEIGTGINSTIQGVQDQINNAASSATSSFGNLTSAASSFNFQMPSLEQGARRAAGAMRDFGQETEGVPQALGDGPGGLGRAARGAEKDVIDLAEAFDIAANKLRQRVEFIAAFGEIGAKAAAALSDAILVRTPANADKAVDSLFEIIDAMREAGIPNFIELGDELIGAFREAIVDGTPGATTAALELLQQFATEVGLAGKLTVDSFQEAFNRATLGAAIGKEADSVMAALNKAFVDGSKKNRDALANAALSYIEALRKNFSPEEAAKYGEEVMAALNQSIETGSSEFIFAVFDQISVDLQQQGRLTAQTFARAFEATSAFEARGAGGKLIDALVQGMAEGGTKNIRAISDSAFSVIQAFSSNLSRENARDLTNEFMSELAATIADGSSEALANFSRFVTDLNIRARELKLAEEIAKQFEDADERIQELLRTSAANRHIENLRNALRIDQEIALDVFQTRQEIDQINRRRDQEDVNTNVDRQRKLEDLETEHQRRLADIRRKAIESQKPVVASTSLSSRSIGGDKEIEEEKRKHKEKLADLKIEFERADTDRINLRNQQDADRAYTKQQETEMRKFREYQAGILHSFEFNIDATREAQRITDIQKELNKKVDALKEENEKAKVLYGQRLTSLKEQFLDPAHESMRTLFDDAMADLDIFIERLAELEVTVTVKNKEKNKTSKEPTGKPGDSNEGPVAGSFQHGGIIPGFGPKLIRAHGGEIVFNPRMMPIASAQKVAPSINQSTTVNNLTVNANYAQTQSPVQVQHDMHALIMLAGGR